MVFLLSACSVSIIPQDKNNSGELLSRPYAGYINSGTYYLKYSREMQQNNQTLKIEFETAAQNGDSAERSGAAPARVGMNKGGVSYLVDHTAKTVTEYSQAMTTESSALFDFKRLTYSKTGSVDSGGKTYAYDEYTTDAGKNIRFCFDGQTLVGLQITSGDSVIAAVTVLELSAKIPSYLFDIPADFAKTKGGTSKGGAAG